MASNTIRFTGLASGLDTQSLVESMILPYKTKVDTAVKNQTMLQWKKEAWRGLNTKMYSFYNKQLGSLRLESSYSKKVVSNSNPTAITLDSSNTLPIGTHKIKEISQLASGATVQTQKLTRVDETDKEPITEKTTLGELGITEDTTFTLNGKEVKVGKDTTIASLTKGLNNADKNVNITFDSTAQAFFMSTQQTGASQNISLSSSTADGLEKIGIKFEEGVVDKTAVSVSGENAKLIYNGVEIESETNKISVNGLNFTINTKATEEIMLVATQDTEAIVDNVKNFIEAYNELIADLNEKVNAPNVSGYTPLTEEQKASMSESEIEKWEKTIKDSIFRKDADVQNILTSMRNILGEKVEGNVFGSLSAIGITTGNYKENGKLYLDEEKLREAIEKDADAVVQLFAGNSEDSSKKGIMDRMYDTFTEQTKFSSTRSTYSFYNDKVLAKNITSYDSEIKKLEKRMYTMEEMYYAKFTAMEKMLSSLNNQSNWLYSQM